MSSVDLPVTHRVTSPVVDAAPQLIATPAYPAPIKEPERDWPRVRGYEVLSQVGRGGMGVVYKARHRELGRTVAIKTLRGAALSDPEFRERFRAEAEAAARLQHPNVVQVFEVGTTDPRIGDREGEPYIALEFVDCGDLTRLTVAPQSPRTAARLVEKLARAAFAAHRLGVVHRDLKPANVLLDASGEPKIADFGVAKQLLAEPESGMRFVTQAGIAVGTPEYMAPEQVKGEAATPAIDTYALGVILYELLTGRLPFQGPDASTTMELVRKQEPVPPRRLQPRLPRDLETICLKCLEKQPARRYTSAEALADDLARWLDGHTIMARPVGHLERATRWATRNPTVASLSAAIPALTMIGLAGVSWKWQEAKAHAADAQAHHAAERRARYLAVVVSAANALRLNDARGASRSLMAAPAEHRDWEWRHFVSKLESSRQTLSTGKPGKWVYQVTSDGRRVAISTDQHIHVWDTETGKQIGAVEDRAAADRASMSLDGRTLAYRPYGPESHTVQLWDVPTGRKRADLRGHPVESHTAHFTADGTKLATGAHDGSVIIWDVASGNKLHVLAAHTAATASLAFDPSGSRLATTCPKEGCVRVWDVASGRLLHTLTDPGADLNSPIFCPTAPLLAVIESTTVNRVRLWSLETGRPVAELGGHKNRVTDAVFSPDGSRLVTTSLDQSARMWAVPGGQVLAELRGHTGRVYRSQFSHDGTRLLTASQDQTARLWDGKTGEPLAVLHGHTGEVTAAGFTADGATIVTASRDGTARLWSTRRVEQDGGLRGHTSFVYGVAIHPDGRRVASAAWDGTVRVWDTVTGTTLQLLRHTGTGINAPVTSVAFHPAGKLLASLGRDKSVRLWQADTGEALHVWSMPTHAWLDGRLAFSPAGDLLAVGVGDGSVRLLDPTSRAEVAVLTGHTDAVRDVAFSPDGRWLASGGDALDKTIRVWDVARRTEVKVLRGHDDQVYALAISPSGDLLVSGSTDGTIRLWDTTTWEQVGLFRPAVSVYGLAFTPNGRRLAAACADNGIRLYDVANREEVVSLTGHTAYVHAVAFTRDGRRLVSASGDATIRLWDTIDQTSDFEP